MESSDTTDKVLIYVCEETEERSSRRVLKEEEEGYGKGIRRDIRRGEIFGIIILSYLLLNSNG